MKSDPGLWGSLKEGELVDPSRGTLRRVLDDEISDSRVFVGQLYREYIETGRRVITSRLMERGRNLPWSIFNSRNARP